MGTELFLGCVALFAVALTALLGRSLIRKKRRPGATHRQTHHHQPLYEHRGASISRLHSHHTRVAAEQDIWKADRLRAAAERWHTAKVLTAGHLRTDEELEQESKDQVAMSVIEYVPTDLPRTGARGSQGPRARDKKS